MSQSTEALDCVAFMLIADNAILVEKRSMTKRLLPGALAIPGGHVEAGESIEAALVRELQEELDITPQRFFHVCTLLHQAEELRRIHYFVVEQWTGEMRALEAESLCWLPLDELAALDLEIDMEAIESYTHHKAQWLPCPCCGYLTMGEPGQYDICPVCFWEDDPIQRDDEDFEGGANKESLRQARANFRAFGAMAMEFKKYVRDPLPREIPNATGKGDF